MNKRSPASDATLSVHAGEDRHGRNAPLTTEIQQTSVFALKNTEQLRLYAAGDPSVFLYTRYGNPTLRAAEEKIAALEHGEDCVLTASGLAAELAVALTLCRSGDEIVSMLDIYGGTTSLFSNCWAAAESPPALFPSPNSSASRATARAKRACSSWKLP